MTINTLDDFIRLTSPIPQRLNFARCMSNETVIIIKKTNSKPRDRIYKSTFLRISFIMVFTAL